MMSSDQKSILNLLTPEAVRLRCHEILEMAEADALEHFRFHPENLKLATENVLEEINSNYPDGQVPFHSRWRHFEFGRRNLWQDLFHQESGLSTAERARRRIDLAIISVLLDAGAGANWQYEDAETGLTYRRSEGLALASLRLLQSGILSQYGQDDPLRVDARQLTTIAATDIAQAFQVTDTNPIVGLEARADLLNRLGIRLIKADHIFDRHGDIRPGNLFDQLISHQVAGKLKAREILVTLLIELGEIWPDGEIINGISVGDVGRHRNIIRDDVTNGVLPFHKLSQWMAYSLIEPLEEAKITVVDLDDLTGLAEYRNGGLFMDTKTISLRDQANADTEHDPKSELVVEWRALTIALLDKITASVRQHMDKDPTSLPLASILQGGTWSAGRRLANQLRVNGGPPIHINSTGTIF